MTLIPSQQSRMELWLRQSKGRGQRERWIFWQKQSDEPAMQREARKANAWKSSLPASPVHTQPPAAPLILPREGLPTAWHPQGRTGAGEAQSLHCRAEWALLSTGLSLSLCSPMEPRVPLTSVLSLEHGEWPPAVGHPWRRCPQGPSHLLAKRSPTAGSCLQIQEQSSHKHKGKPFTSTGHTDLGFTCRWVRAYQVTENFGDNTAEF